MQHLKWGAAPKRRLVEERRSSRVKGNMVISHTALILGQRKPIVELCDTPLIQLLRPDSGHGYCCEARKKMNTWSAMCSIRHQPHFKSLWSQHEAANKLTLSRTDNGIISIVPLRSVTTNCIGPDLMQYL